MSNSIFKGPIELPCPILAEGLAAAAMFPGNILASDFDLADAATVGQLLIARDGGPGKGEYVDTEYAIGDSVTAYKARQGLIFAVRVASGEALVKGVTLLERSADGQLTVLSSGEAVAVAAETITTTSDDELVEVEIL